MQDALTIIKLIEQQNPGEREINLKSQNLNVEQVDKLEEIVAHAQCPPFALNLEYATAPTIRAVLARANEHKPLTRLNLRNFAVIRDVVDSTSRTTSKSFSITAEHLGLIAEMLGPGSQLEELILDGQWLLPSDDTADGYRYRRDRPNDRQKNFEKLLSAVGAASSMKTLSIMGCDLFHQDLPVIGKKLFAQATPCALTSLALAYNFGEELAPRFVVGAALAVTKFLKQAGDARCLESLDLGQSVRRHETFNAGLLTLVSAVKTLCHVSPCPDGEAGPTLEIRQRLASNRRARMASSCEMALCVQPYHLPVGLVGKLVETTLAIEQHSARFG